MNNKILTFIIAIFIYSCTNTDKIKYSCYENKLELTFEKSYGKFIFFDTLFKIEKKIIDDKFISDNSRDSYLNFINNLDTTKTVKMEKYLDQINSYSVFFKEMSVYGGNVFKECCSCECVEKDVIRKETYDSILVNGFSKSYLKKIYEETNFDDDYDRVILLNFIYLYIHEVLEKEHRPALPSEVFY